MVWKTKRLGELCDVFTDGNWIETKDQSSSGVRLIQTGNVGIGVFKDRADKARFISEDTFSRLKCTEIFPGDCLISRLPDPAGRACVIPETGSKMITAVDCTIVRFKNNIVMPDFFNYFSQSKDYLAGVDVRTSGATRKRISRKNLGQVEIPVPSLAEQKQIITILEEAFANIDHARQLAERNLKNAHELFDNSLRAIFESVIGNQFANQDLEALCELIVDCEHKTAPIEEAGYPSIRTPNIQRGHLSLENVNKVSEETYRQWTRRAVPLPGDLIMAREAPAGNVAVIPDGIQPCLGQRTLLIRPKSEIFISEYLMWYLLSPEVQIRLLSTSRGATVQHLNMKDIRALEIKYIPELSEQKRIADSIEDIRLKTKKLEAIYQQKITALNELKQSLLQKAFRGELMQAQTSAA